ncbi:MAG: ATP-dependent DNA helicase [Candidatus Pacebacteria bacterium]|nr:ATP-dependent DNA helicase [Candidatus Paceibacterota bacterium]
MSFKELYNKLNLEQKKAVDLIEGPVMVIAGPGTGKTRILTLRIANILKKTDIEPENILALTFTDSGAFLMRSNLVKIIGSSGYLVNISTFHRFCNNIINTRPEDFPEIAGSTTLTDTDQVKIIKSIIEKSSLKILKPYGDPFFYLKAVISSIDKLKREGIGPEDLSKITKREKEEFEKNPTVFHQKGKHEGKMKGEFQKIWKRIEKNKELSVIYKEYQKELRALKAYDYSDMIMEVLKALSKNKDLLLSLQEQYQYILIDEHQDTNNGQNKILELIASFHNFPNIFIVGDEKQAIYRFQGASLLNFNHFKSLYPEMKVIKLKKNYRSTKDIVDAANDIISSKLETVSKQKSKKIKILSFYKNESENLFIAEDIGEKIKKGINPSEIAVIYRDNKDGLPIARFLQKKGIPFSVESEELLTNDIDIKKLVILLSAINEFGNEEKMIEAMHLDFLKIDFLDIFILIKESQLKRKPLYGIIRSKDIDSSTLYSKRTIVNFLKMLSSFAVSSKNDRFTFFLEKVINDSGFLSYLLDKPDSIDKINKLKVFFKEAEKYERKGLEEFMEYLELAEKYRLPIKKTSANYSSKKIRLLTAHRAKGLEFDCVYISKATYGHWGDRKNRNILPLSPLVFSLSKNKIEERDENNDERKLFYVALTRAKKEVLISYSDKNEEGREQIPSRFVQEIKNGSFLKIEGKTEEKLIFTPSLSKTEEIKDKNLIKNTFLSKGLSATGLNNYLQCPLKYFYSNLLKIPKSPEKHQIYGIAVHDALKDFFESLRYKKTDKNFLLLKFSHYLKRKNLENSDFEELKRKGEKALGGYYEFYKGKWATNILSEFNIKSILFSPDILLSGKIDKIEFLDSKGNVNVVDYKTGKPRSKNYIEGKTENSDGNIKRQLIFYNLLLDKYKKGKYKMASGEIDFIEPNERNFYKKEKIEIRKEEKKEMEEMIKKTAKEILSLSFLNKGCKKEDCYWCKLNEMRGK